MLKGLIKEVLEENPELISNVVREPAAEYVVSKKKTTIDDIDVDSIIDRIFDEYDDVLRALA